MRVVILRYKDRCIIGQKEVCNQAWIAMKRSRMPHHMVDFVKEWTKHTLLQISGCLSANFSTPKLQNSGALHLYRISIFILCQSS